MKKDYFEITRIDHPYYTFGEYLNLHEFTLDKKQVLVSSYGTAKSLLVNVNDGVVKKNIDRKSLFLNTGSLFADKEMAEKFGFTGVEKQVELNGVMETVKQIVAKKQIRTKDKKIIANIGDVGGWIGDELVLSTDYGCWVADSAVATKGTRVLHDAQIIDNACVYEGAMISGKCVVSKDAHVRNHFWLMGANIDKGATTDRASFNINKV